jgi:Flp pilus assembly protein TadD
MICGLAAWLTLGLTAGVVEFFAATVVPGVLCYRFGGYRERLALPVPDYARLKAASEHRKADSDTRAKEIEEELRRRMANAGSRRNQAKFLISESYSALGKCDYLPAMVAADLCLRINARSVEGTLAFAIAAAGLGQGQQVAHALQVLQRNAPLSGPSISWGVAWALVLVGDWAYAEAFLQSARKGRPDQPTLLALLAICQARRGKLLSAISSARHACAPQPRNKEYAKLLIDLLLDGGLLREARQALARLEPDLAGDEELRVAMVRLNLLLRNNAAAEEWAAKLDAAGPPMRVRLGGIYAAARQGDKAEAHYLQALASGYYPEALLGLGRWEAQRNNKKQARYYFRSALDIQQKVAEGAVGVLEILPQPLHELMLLEEPMLGCRAWIATLHGGVGPAGLAGRSFWIHAPNRVEAERHLESLLGAMQPRPNPGRAAVMAWREAPREQQPDGPVRPGVQPMVVE